jgi:hypothetical protein
VVLSSTRGLLADAGGAKRHPQTQQLANAVFTTVRLRLLKIAVRIEATANRVRLAFGVNCPEAALFRGLIGALALASTVTDAGMPRRNLVLTNPQRMTNTA